MGILLRRYRADTLIFGRFHFLHGQFDFIIIHLISLVTIGRAATRGATATNIEDGLHGEQSTGHQQQPFAGTKGFEYRPTTEKSAHDAHKMPVLK